MKILSFLALLAASVGAKDLDPTVRAALKSADPKAGPSARSEMVLRKAIKKAQAQQKQAVFGSTTGSGGSSFDPEFDDAMWPGEYPSGKGLMLNWRNDDWPSEFAASFDVAFSTESTSVARRSYKPPKIKQSSAKGTLAKFSIDFWNKTDTLYRIEVQDTAGDGICCNAGEGW